MLNGPPTERQNFCCAKSSAGASRGEYCPKSKSIEKEVAVGLADFVNSWIIAHLHIAAAHRAAHRDVQAILGTELHPLQLRAKANTANLRADILERPLRPAMRAEPPLAAIFLRLCLDQMALQSRERTFSVR